MIVEHEQNFFIPDYIMELIYSGDLREDDLVSFAEDQFGFGTDICFMPADENQEARLSVITEDEAESELDWTDFNYDDFI